MLGQPSTPTRKRITAAAVSLPGMPGTGACPDDAYNLDTLPKRGGRAGGPAAEVRRERA